MPIRVLIADDQQLVRTGFRMIVNAQADMPVAGEAADGQEAVELAACPGAYVDTTPSR
jgi:YesN/AraC family two-component response regulator